MEALLEMRDFYAVARHHGIKPRTERTLIPLCVAMAVLALLADRFVVRVIWALLVVAFATLPIWLPVVVTYFQARGSAWAHAPTRWRVGGDGLSMENDVGAATIRWSSIGAVESWRKGVSFTYGKEIIFIPSRGFQDDQHREELVSAAQIFIAVARAV